jgi:acyl-CoA thioester hydrolase
MPSVKLDVISVPVRISDINYGNHLGNDSLVSILHDARVQWLKRNNYSELDIEGAGLIMSELTVEYKSESFHGDILDIAMFIGEQTAVSFEIYYEVMNQEKKLVSNARTTMVCFNYQLKKVTAIPPKFSMLINP